MWIIVFRNVKNNIRFFTWKIVKVLFYKYIKKIKSFDQNIYTKWIFVDVRLCMDVCKDVGVPA